MIPIFIICIVAFLTSILTFFSGFGLGTILTPVFAIFFPVEIAISLTAIVHFLNNIFKLTLVGLPKEKEVIIKFGIPSLLFAFLGALLLTYLSSSLQTPVAFFNFTTNPVKIVIGSLILLFTLVEVVPFTKKIEFDKKYLFAGGALSGFFGGLSGNQGALRTLFLSKINLTKEAFISTGIVLACMVDVSRLIIYSEKYFSKTLPENIHLLIPATLSAFAGAFIGSRFLKKITFPVIKTIITCLLIVLSSLLILGVI